MKNFFKEFKEFIARGNVVDMAVGIIIGSAFTSIVNSLVTDILTPITTMFTKDLRFSEIQFHGLMIGNFINAIISFLLTALALFCIVKTINRFKKNKQPDAPVTKICPYCKSEIPIDATRCPNCTSELEEEQQSA